MFAVTMSAEADLSTLLFLTCELPKMDILLIIVTNLTNLLSYNRNHSDKQHVLACDGYEMMLLKQSIL